MKIRIRDNSIRLRLTKSEVNDFCENGIFQSETNFPNTSFKYALKSDDSVNQLHADFNANSIIVLIPSSYILDWSKSEKVGFSNKIKLPNGHSLLVKVEKDFVCLDETEEDQSDNYPNPRN